MVESAKSAETSGIGISNSSTYFVGILIIFLKFLFEFLV
jgi:hypothetical protein